MQGNGVFSNFIVYLPGYLSTDIYGNFQTKKICKVNPIVDTKMEFSPGNESC